MNNLTDDQQKMIALMDEFLDLMRQLTTEFEAIMGVKSDE